MTQPIQIKNSTVPPTGIYEMCRDKFGVDFRDGVVFTVGDTIHAQKFPLPPDLYAHERTHVEQQSLYDGGWKAWWQEYLDNPYFRYTQEMQAYRVQYMFFCNSVKDRNQRARFAHRIVQQIMTLYGFNEIQLTSQKAMADLKR